MKHVHNSINTIKWGGILVVMTIGCYLTQTGWPLPRVEAQTTEYKQSYDELKLREQKKSELEQKIYDAKKQEKTLANQIKYLENQVSLTELEQQDTRDEIGTTESQLGEVNVGIEGLSGKLTNLDTSISGLYEVLSARIRAGYQIESVNLGGYVLDQRNFQQLVLQAVYLKELQKEDNRLLTQMSDMKNAYERQKADLESLKKEKEELKAQLEHQNETLENQKQELSRQQGTKTWLLSVTKNEEQKYQVLLAQVEEEIRAIRNALASLGTRIGEVKKGDVIAHVGNTGCSTGSHLHFGYYVGGAAVDPSTQLNSGDLLWPVADPQVTQWFNDPNTRDWYQINFGISGHNGIDMIDASVGSGAPVLAAADGTAYRVSDSKACWLTGTVGQGVRIDHPDGSKSIYWHVQ